MKVFLTLVLSFLFLASFAETALAILPVDLDPINSVPNKTPDAIAAEMVPGATVTPLSAVYTGVNAASGTFKAGLVDGLGIDAGFLFTTGALINAVGPNLNASISIQNAALGDAGLNAIVAPDVTLDASVLQFQFQPANLRRNFITFQVVFASDEYSEQARGGIFSNDVFGMFLDGVNIAKVPGTTSPISVTTISLGSNPTLFNDNDPLFFGTPTPFATQYDGFSKVLTISAPINARAAHSLKVAIADTTDNFTDSAVFISPATFLTVTNIGTFRTGTWPLDVNGNGIWNGAGPALDQRSSFGLPTDIPVTGDWTGTGTTKIGVFRASGTAGTWFLDMNGNGIWEGPTIDKQCTFGLAADKPVTGDWDGTGATKIGVFRNSTWVLDFNGNCAWDGPGTDSLFTFGLATDIPVTGNWSGAPSTTTKVGTFRNGTWFIDMNGNGIWDGPVTDRQSVFGLPTDKPVTGDWNGDGKGKIGIFRNGSWSLDLNGNGVWNGPVTDKSVPAFGLPTDRPVTGVW